ncbi:MAG: TonB family protein [Gammaproteobacteria bacterium]
MYAIWETIREFLDRGGPVIVVIAWVIFAMWIVIIERVLYLSTENRTRMKAGLAKWEAREDPKSWASRAIYDAEVSRLSQHMEGGVELIRTFSRLCPLLGLLGTVTGMIVIFDVMAAMGSSSPRAMAGGVARATMPTMAGMVGALSGIFPAAALARLAQGQEKSLQQHHLSAAQISGPLVPWAPSPVRMFVALVASFFITASLLFLMQTLIETGRKALTDSSPVTMAEFVRIKRPEQIERREEKPQKIMPEVKPQTVTQKIDRETDVGAIDIGLDQQSLMDVNVGGFGVSSNLGDYGMSDAEYMPIVRVVPLYPRQAAVLGLEGYVIVSFTVTTTGTVKDCVIVESTNAIFNRAAVQAALKFKYKPRVIDGNPVEVHDVQTKLTFQFEE